MEVRYPLENGLTLVLDIDMLEVQVLADSLVTRVRTPGPLLNQVARYLRHDVFARNFREGGPGWAPNAASTIAAKQNAGMPALTAKGRVPWRLKQGGRFGPGDAILIVSGALRDSYVRKGAKGHVEEIDADSGTVEVGSDMETKDGKPLAVYMQRGWRGGTITAKNGKSLRFTGSNGQPVFRRSVHNPGYPARPQEITAADLDGMAALVVSHLTGEPQRSQGD